MTKSVPGKSNAHRLARDGVQVSRGLNLVLELEDRSQMPSLMKAILDRQPQIGLALNELHFVHFARFLPTRDQSALLVITEFDGPLEPYVMDFAIAIEEPFSAILSFIRDRPRLPVRNHPDEFLAFVKRNNRVVIGDATAPKDFDYPVFSAYPSATVLDIIGRRTQLPPPVVDRAAADVDLADVQGNILRGYGAQHARHFVLTVSQAMKAGTWLAELATAPQGSIPAVTTAMPWEGGKPATMLNVGMTWDGLGAMGIDSDLLMRFPTAFREGPARRAAANGDNGAASPSRWRLGAPGSPAHLMLSLYAFAGHEAEFAAASAAIVEVLEPNGLSLLSVHDADELPDRRDPFGYRDGIAQPRIAGFPKRLDDLQPAASPGEFLLGPDYQDIFGGPSLGDLPPELALNGTYCAVRLMAQDVEQFETLLDAGATLSGAGRELIAAKLVGRWRDGEPVSLDPDGRAKALRNPVATGRNDFDYAPSWEFPATFDDHDGARCPIGAHIRRVNPRTSRAAGMRYSRRLIRRGMPYQWSPPDTGPTENGIFGQFLCGSLERQFEFILQQWVNGDIFTSGIRGTQDPIVGAQATSGTFILPGMGPGGSSLRLQVPRLVTTRGSLYLFVPGIRALQSLGTARKPLPGNGRQPLPGDGRKPLPGDDRKALPGDGRQPLPGDEPQAAPFATIPPSAPAPTTASITSGIFAVNRDRIEQMAAALVHPGMTTTMPPVPRTAAEAPFDLDSFDPTDPAFLANPYPIFAAFRHLRPIHYVPRHESFWVFRHGLVDELCRDSTRFLKLPPDSDEPRGLFTLDPPRHTQVRAMMEEAFGAALAVVPAIAARVCDGVIADIRGDSFDLVESFARRVPREILFAVLGVPEADAANVDSLTRFVMMRSDRTLSAAEQWEGTVAAIRLGETVMRLLEAAPGGPRETLFHAIASQTGQLYGQLTEAESAMTALHFLFGGYLSTEFLLCTGIRNLLLDDGAPWRTLQANPALLPQAVDEMRRFDTPLGVVDRYAAHALEWEGVSIPAGARLMGMLGAANHDERVFGRDAERFDITNEVNGKHLALGRGIHECIGKPLQARVVPLAVRGLMAAFPDLALASQAQPPWIMNPYFRSFTRLMVVRQPPRTRRWTR